MVFNIFIINGEVIFDANSCELKSLASSSEVITLNAPTARCLQLLLQKDGQVISRDNFMEHVWQARGIVVSQNTFYQNISLLRKSLKKAGLTEDIVVTVRRKGFILAADTQVEMVKETAQPSFVNNGNSTVIYPQIQPSADVDLEQERCEPVKSTASPLNFPRWVVVLFVILIVLELASLIGSYIK